MPKLPDYESPLAARGLQPSAMGVDANEQAGRSIKASFDSLGNSARYIGNTIEQHNEAQDASELTADAAQTYANLTKSWNDTAAQADPNATDTADKWRQDQLEPALEKIGANATSKKGQQDAEKARAQLRMEFFRSTIGDQMQLNGDAVLQNFENATSSLANNARRDPSTMGPAIGLLSTLIDNQVKAHTLDAGVAAKLKTELLGKAANTIAEQAFFGLAEKNAPAAQTALDDGTFDGLFSPQQMQQARGFVTAQAKLNTTLIEKQNKDASESDMAAIQSTTIDKDTGELTIPRDYFANVATWASKWAGKPGAGDSVAEKTRTAIQFGRSIMDELAKGKPAVTDPHTYADFASRVTLAQGGPDALTEDQVIQARADGKLSDKDYTFFKGALTKLAQDPAHKAALQSFNTFIRGIRSSITRSNILMGNNDPAGDQKMLQFQQRATQEFEDAYAKGNWRDLLERNNKNSLWHQAVPYMTDQKGAMESLQNSINGAPGLVPSISAPARQKGETAADYLKRTGGK